MASSSNRKQEQEHLDNVIKCMELLFEEKKFVITPPPEMMTANKKLPTKKGTITEIMKNLGYPPPTPTDQRVLLDKLFNAPKNDESVSAGVPARNYSMNSASTSSTTNNTKPTTATVTTLDKPTTIRKNFNFVPPRPKAIQRFQVADDEVEVINKPSTAGSANDQLDYDPVLLDRFCKKLRTGQAPFQQAIPPVQLKHVEPAVHLQQPSKSASSVTSFRTAHEQMIIDDKAKGIKRQLPPSSSNVHVSGLRKMARLDTGAGSSSKGKDDDEEGTTGNPEVQQLLKDERLVNCDPKMIETILNEIMEVNQTTDWDDIAGLEDAKAIIREIIIWPLLRPDIFTGLLQPPKGLLLFGPPGTGKTMIGRLIAAQSGSTFFNISASSLTSKWIGDNEKIVRTLFQLARVKQPAVIFIDEIDSILCQRSDTEHESSRRLKTEFLIQFDGCATSNDDRILVIGVTNRPQELDEAARRRLVKRIYIPLPDVKARKHLVKHVLRNKETELNEADFDRIAEMTDGFSGADMTSLIREAAFEPIRDVSHNIMNIQLSNVRLMKLNDFESAFKRVKASVAPGDLVNYEKWDRQFGCHI